MSITRRQVLGQLGAGALLGAVRKVAADLARQGKIEILRKGKPINPDDMRGVIRLRATS
jgi:hypothetical protein